MAYCALSEARPTAPAVLLRVAVARHGARKERFGTRWAHGCRRWFPAVLLATLTAGAVGADELKDIQSRMKELQGKITACGANTTCMQPYIDEMMQLGQRAGKLAEEMCGTGQEGQSAAQPAATMPPELQRLHDMANRVDLDLDPLTQCDEINHSSDEILKEIAGQVSPRIKGAFLPVRWCRETEATIQETGHGRTDSWDLSYQLEARMDAAWTDSYFVRPGTDKVHSRGFTLHAPPPESTKNEVQVLRVSGSIPMFDGQRLRRAPPARWKVHSGASLVIGPIEVTSGIGDPESWPDELFSRYLVQAATPFVSFLPGGGTAVPPEGIPVPCLKGALDRTYLEPEELWAGATGDDLRVVVQNSSSDPSCLSSTTVITVGSPPGQCDPGVTSLDGAMVADGDCLDHGGTVLAGDDTVFVNGRRVARVGDPALCRMHGLTRITRSGVSSVFATGDPVARIGDVTECGARIVGGSPDTFVGGG